MSSFNTGCASPVDRFPQRSGLAKSRWCPRGAPASFLAATSCSTNTSYSVDQVKFVNGKIVSDPRPIGNQDQVLHASEEGLRPTARPRHRVDHLDQTPRTPAARLLSDDKRSSPVHRSEPLRPYNSNNTNSPNQNSSLQTPKLDPPRGSSSSSSAEIILDRPTVQLSNNEKSKPSEVTFWTIQQNMKNTKRNSKWPSAAAVKYDPRNHPERNTPREYSDVPSNEADFNELVTARRYSQGRDYELADWTGALAPAPVDWDDRPAFVDHRIQDKIREWEAKNDFQLYHVEIGEHHAVVPANFTRETWIDQCQADSSRFECTSRRCTESSCEKGNGEHFSKTLQGEIALRSWIPKTIEGRSLEAWWTQHLRTPGSETDIEPFWRRFTSQTSQTLTALVTPETAVEPSDNDMSRVSRQTADYSSLTFDNKQLRQINKAKKDRKEQNALANALNNYVPSPNQYAPRINIYLRPVESRDLAQIAEIYNHYIENTIFSPEPSPLRPSSIRSRWEDVVEVRLPFLVAVDRSAKGARRRGPNNTIIQDEHILGFALADDYNDANGMYRYTVEIEVFVRPEFVRCGVGRSLIDKLLFILDPHYVECGACDFVGDPVAFGSGGRRVVGSVMVNIPYDSKDRSRLEWLARWLSQFDFKQVGDFPEVGHKLNKVVNQAVMIKKTGSGVKAGAL